jgi:hypothetical protein
MAPTNGVKTRSRDLLANRRSAMTTTMTTTKTMKTTTKTLTALALAAAALTVMVGPSNAAPRFEKLGAATKLIAAQTVPVFHHLPISTVPIFRPLPIILPPTSHPPISCFTCKLPHGPQGGARPPYGWGYGNHWPYHGFGNRWGYGHYNWYRWHPVYYGGAPVAAEPVAAAPVATIAAPQAPIGGCDCLTKQMLPNGAELLQDICTKQSAVARPQALSAR